MKRTTLVVGMDVHKESISVSVLEAGRKEARPTVKLRNDATELKRLFGRLKKEGEVKACYEAGSCGYEVQRLLAGMKVECDVIAPSLIPVRSGDRAKTYRRDAEKLARLYRAGELTSIRIPNEAEEALRDVVRCREDVREDVLRERDRLLKLLLRHGRTFTGGQKNWSMAHWKWLRQQSFENPMAQMVFTDYLVRLESTLGRLRALDQELAAAAEQEPYKGPVARLRCLRGIDTLSAVILVAEICDFDRFARPDQFMAFVGLVPSERSSGAKERRGALEPSHGPLAPLDQGFEMYQLIRRERHSVANIHAGSFVEPLIKLRTTWQLRRRRDSLKPKASTWPSSTPMRWSTAGHRPRPTYSASSASPRQASTTWSWRSNGWG